jgi:hypothetical protein
MKTFVIIMLSIAILGNVLGLSDYIRDDEDAKAGIATIIIIGFILALIFTCHLH